MQSQLLNLTVSSSHGYPSSNSRNRTVSFSPFFLTIQSLVNKYERKMSVRPVTDNTMVSTPGSEKHFFVTPSKVSVPNQFVSCNINLYFMVFSFLF